MSATGEKEAVSTRDMWARCILSGVLAALTGYQVLQYRATWWGLASAAIALGLFVFSLTLTLAAKSSWTGKRATTKTLLASELVFFIALTAIAITFVIPKLLDNSEWRLYWAIPSVACGVKVIQVLISRSNPA